MCANTIKGKSVGRMLAGSESHRKMKRKKIKPVFKDLTEEGKAADGTKAMTRPLGKLGISQPYGKRFGILKIRFRREEHKPKKTTLTDIFNGVRQSEHIPENYTKELSKNDAILWSIGIENLKTAAESMDGKTIGDAIENLRKVFKSLGRIKVEKKKFSRKQLEETIALLGKALEKEEIDTGRVNWACTKLMSFRTRFGNWRDKEIVYTSEYSKLRGYALRKLRDDVLLGYVEDWKRYLADKELKYKMKALWKKDLRLYDVLEELIANSVINRDKLREIFEKYDPEPMEPKRRYNMNKLKNAYVELLSGNDEKAEKIIHEYARVIIVRNPLYAAKEMEKEEDEYYHKIAYNIREAAKKIIDKIPDAAVRFLEIAKKEIENPTLQKSLSFPSPSQ